MFCFVIISSFVNFKTVRWSLMLSKIYLGDAFGWDTEAKSKVAISTLREENKIETNKCPKAQLIKNEWFRGFSNAPKVLGYLPVLNVIVGISEIIFGLSAGEEETTRPNNGLFWIARGVVTILTGPLLAVVDLAKTLYDWTIVEKYNTENQGLIDAFNTSHGHSKSYWPGHPVSCGG